VKGKKMKKTKIKTRTINVLSSLALLLIFLQGSVYALEIPQGKTGRDYAAEAQKHVQGVGPEKVKEMLERQEKFVLLDIRSFGEFKEFGWIKGSTVLPHGMVIFKITKIVPDSDIPIIVYCKKGNRSSMVAYDLKQMGYTNVKYLDGGIIGWKRQKFPVETSGVSKIATEPVVPPGEDSEKFVEEANKIAEKFVEEANKVVDAKKPEEAKKWLTEKSDCVLLDVRTEQEIKEQGAIEGALVMEYGKVPFNITKKVHNADAPFLVVCKQGGRSALIAKMLSEMGYHDVHHIEGGILAWKKQGLYVKSAK
jgi:rhodanese-related sulfurtransferase